MLRITCPYCGTRDQAEFIFGGEGGIYRPADPGSSSDVEWADYLFYRNNAKGPHVERWVHRFGCRQWFHVTRDGRPIRNAWRSMAQVPDQTDISRKMSRDLKQRGFKFVGPVICYAFMQATGMVNDHLVDCFRYSEV